MLAEQHLQLCNAAYRGVFATGADVTVTGCSHRRHAAAATQQQHAWRGASRSYSSSCYAVARVGDSLAAIDTPSLLVDLDGECVLTQVHAPQQLL